MKNEKGFVCNTLSYVKSVIYGCMISMALLAVMPAVARDASECSVALSNALIQDVLDEINIIKPEIIEINNIVILILEEFQTCCSILNSKIDLLSFSASCDLGPIMTKLDVIESKADACCEDLTHLISFDDALILSKLDSLSFSAGCDLGPILTKLDQLSISACDLGPIRSQLDVIESKADACCEDLTNLISFGDALILSKLDTLSFSAGCDLGPILTKLDQLSISACDLGPIRSQLDIIEGDIATCCADLGSRIDALGACGATPITGPTVITVEGVYCVANPIMGEITISSSNVVLDINGYRITGGVDVTSGFDQVTIRNGVVQGASDAIDVMSGCRNITIENVTAKAGTVGIHLTGVTRGTISNCEMTQNITGLELVNCTDISIDQCSAISNVRAGFSLLTSSTNCLRDCKALGTGDGNNTIANNTVFGFIAQNGSGNIFERCIANSTQALSTTDSNSVIAGFALRGDEMCSKIIDSEAANATTNVSGVTVPFGILLEGTLTTLTSVTVVDAQGLGEDFVNAVDWSSDGIYLAVGGDLHGGSEHDLIVYQFDRAAGTLTQVTSVNPGGLNDTVRSVNWSPDGMYLAIGGTITGDDVVIYRFDSTIGSLTRVASVSPVSTVFAVDWSANGQYLAIGGLSASAATNSLFIYKFNRVAEQLTLLDAVNPLGSGSSVDTIRSVKWSPDWQYLAVGGTIVGSSSNDDLIIYRFDSGTGLLDLVTSVNPLGGLDIDSVNSVDWSPDGQYLAVGGAINGSGNNDDVIVYRFDRATGSLLFVTSVNPRGGSGDTVAAVNWSPDGKYLAVGGGIYGSPDNNDLVVYRFDRGASLLIQVASISPGGGSSDIVRVNWSPDGQYLAVGGTIDGVDLAIYRAIQFPVDNLIKNNTVYCNSGARFPSGVGISGSSICNLIIQNTAYSNPTNPPIVSTNYEFVCNVFNQLFGDAPTLLQNIALGTCEPISTPDDIGLLVKQTKEKVIQVLTAVSQLSTQVSFGDALILTKLDTLSISVGCDLGPIMTQLDIIEGDIATCCDDLGSRIDALGACGATPITFSTTINAPGSYCLANSVAVVDVQSSDVVLDLNNHIITNGLTIGAFNHIVARNGVVQNTTSADAISVSNGATDVTISSVTARNARVGISFQGVAGGVVEHCELTRNFTGLELRTSVNVVVDDSTASNNMYAGFSLISSSTNIFSDCKAIGTGNNNLQIINNTVIGFSSINGSSNIFERCIANSTQALSTTDSNSIIAGFALRGDEMCSKIIDSEAANATTNVSGVTVPYGILLEGTLTTLVTVTITDPNWSGLLDDVATLDWSSDGIYLAVGGALSGGSEHDLIVYQFDRAAGTLTQVTSVNPGGASDFVRAVNWSPDGLYLAIGGTITGDDVMIYRFDTTVGSLTRVASVSPVGASPVYTVDWSANGQYLAIGGQSSGIDDDSLFVYKFNRVVEQLTLLDAVNPLGSGSGADAVRSVKWSPDWQYLAVGGTIVGSSSDDDLIIYRFDSGTGLLNLVTSVNPLGGGNNDSVESVDWSPDGQYLAVGGAISGSGNDDDVIVYRFDRAAGSLLFVTSVNPRGVGASGDAVTAVNWSPDGKYLAVGGGIYGSPDNNDLVVYRFDRGASLLIQVVSINPEGGTSFDTVELNWSPDGQYLAAGGTIDGVDLAIYRAIQFPVDNLIKGNTVYCNSGARFPSGVGISGSSICNLIIQNTAYSNPTNPPIVSTNYEFVCNVFNQLFGDAPTLLQNIALGTCEPISTPDDIGLLVKQTKEKVVQVLTAVSQLSTQVSFGDAAILTKLDNIDADLETCCATLNSKIGQLSDHGTCLPSLIDVPDDINNLNLDVIQLLKTILLELRGCGCSGSSSEPIV